MSSASHQRPLACCRLQALTCLQASFSEFWCSQQNTSRSLVPLQTTGPFRLHAWTSFPRRRMVHTPVSCYGVGQQPGSEPEIICRLNTRDTGLCLSTWTSPITSFSPFFDSSPGGRAGWTKTGIRDHSFYKSPVHKSSLLYMPVTDSSGRREEGWNTSLPRQESGLSMRDVCLGQGNLLHLCTQQGAVSTYSSWVVMAVFSVSPQINRAHCSSSQK